MHILKRKPMVEGINAKLSYRVQKITRDTADIVIEKISIYLKKSGYKVIERTETVLTFEEDVYSERTSARSDYYTRVDDGKFEVIMRGSEVVVSLIYRVSILRELVFLLIIFIVGITIDYKALILSTVFVVNFIYKINYLNSNILEEVIERDQLDF